MASGDVPVINPFAAPDKVKGRTFAIVFNGTNRDVKEIYVDMFLLMGISKA